MNNKNDIDQLFAGKLGKAEVTPSAAAWEKLEGNLGSQRKSRVGFFMKIAAAVIILLVSVLSWITFSNENGTDSRLADSNSMENLSAPFPKLTGKQEIDNALIVATARELNEQNKKIEKNIFPVQPQATKSHLSTKRLQRKAKIDTQLLASQDTQTEKIKDQSDATGQDSPRVKDEAALTEIRDLTKAVAVQDLHLSDEQPNTSIPQIDKVLETVETAPAVAENTTDELPSVTITYVGDSGEKKKSKFSLKKVFNSAKKLANGDLIADLRDAKDELISSKIKSLND